MPVNIDITASSMTGLLGAVEASKANLSRRSKSDSVDEYNLSRFSKGSKISKASSRINGNKELDRSHRGSNKGVAQRAAKDEGERLRMNASVSVSVTEQLAMEALRRKAEIYEATIQGQAGGLSEQQLEHCPLNIDAKRAQKRSEAVLISDSEEEETDTPEASGSQLPPMSFKGRLHSDHHRQHIAGAVKVMDEEEWIETQDEFGREILVRAEDFKPVTQNPQQTMEFVQTESAGHLIDVQAEYGPQRSFPVLDTSDRPMRKSTADEPVEKYFDSKAERRQLGTGYYALSNDPLERQKQQDELREREAETARARASASDHPPLNDAERAIQERKKQIKAKREELARKRLKSNPVPSPSIQPALTEAGALDGP